MELNDKLIKEISAIGLIILFGVLVFFAIKPILFAIIWGLILGYVFMPVHRKILSYLKNDMLSAGLTLLLAILIVLIPLWFIVPLIVQQIFELFKSSQSFDITGFITNIFPTASQQFVSQFGVTLNTLLGKLASAAMSSIVNLSLNLPLLLVELFIAGFVFFFTLKDIELIKKFIKSISPLSKSKEKVVVQQFNDITYSIIFGRFVVGIIQGLTAGLGFFMFGVHNALILSLIAILLSVLPVVGAFLIWIPVAIYMFAR